MNSKSQTDNKTIAKNTLLLYFRQIITMIVSLFTSRVILNTLGVEDYGIHNVVGGIVTLFSFLTATMASASQRYLSYDLSKNDTSKLKETFSLIMLSYIGIAIIVFVLSETIAVWFLNCKMNIPSNRMDAANWVLQSSILSFIVNILTTPYMSVIIAREKMNVYAYASIGDVCVKLLIVYILVVFSVDKLKLFSVLTFFITFFMTAFYRWYCKRNFIESHYTFFFEKKRMLEMTNFAGWNIIGAISNVLRGQGINILLNIFFNPTINAARGIAYQINNAITNFSNNFYTAVRPQIIKKYAEGNKESMFSLVYISSKFAYYLLLVIMIPIFFETDIILELWLKNPPEYTALFVRLVLINSLLEVLNYPLVNSIQATGRIKTYQMIVSICYLMNIPLSYIALKMEFPPESTMIVNLCLILLCFIPRLLICKKEVGLSINSYFKNVIIKLLLTTIASCVLSYFIDTFLELESITIEFSVKIFFIVLSTTLTILFVGLENSERSQVLKIIEQKLQKK